MALAIADQGIVIERGSISMSGPAADMRESDEIRRMYLGGSSDEEDTIAVQQHSALERWES